MAFNASAFSNTTTGNSGLPTLGVQHVEERSVTEMVVKALCLVAATTVAARHLAHLRRQPTKLAAYQVVIALCIPTFPVADSMIAFYRTVKAMKSTGKGTWSSYHVCSALDIRASSEESEQHSVPLHLIPSTQVRPVVIPYDTKWLLKVAVQSIFLIQLLYTIALWTRRAAYGTRSFYDDYMALTALCAVSVTLLSLCISAMSTKWECPPRYPTIFHTRFRESGLLDMDLGLEVRLASVFAAAIQAVAFLSLKKQFAQEFYHKWQLTCREGGFRVFLALQITQVLSLLFNTEVRVCNPLLEPGPPYDGLHGTMDDINDVFVETFRINANVSIIMALIVSWYVLFPLVIVTVGVVSMWLGYPDRSEMRIRAFRRCFHCYFLLEYCLSLLGIWQLAQSDRSVVWAWKWKDPWAGRFWTFST